MQKIKLPIFLIYCFISFFGIAQELPPIQNFYPSDYNGENQNWAISQSSKKVIYIANSSGLLAYNGATWQLFPSPNETIMRSVKVVEDRIYTGCFMEFGYWKNNDLGTLDYTSLSKHLTIDLLEDEEFWNIINLDDYIVFQSLKRIYIYNVNDESINTINSEKTITKIFKVGQKVYFQRIGEGIFKIESGKDFLVFSDDIVKNDEVINIFERETGLLVLTKRNGFYAVSEGNLEPLDAFPNTFLSDFSMYDGIQLRDGSFVLGTISSGIIHLSETGALIFRIDQNNGLSNNTVLALFEDMDTNIWLGLDHGISYVNKDAPYEVFNDYKGVLGSVYTAALYEDKLYVGTNQGLFYKDFTNKNNQDFTLIPGTQGQVWCLKEIENVLFCGHHSGTFIVDNDRIQKISDVPGTWNIANVVKQSNLLLQGNYDGLYVLERSNNSWKLRNKIQEFNNSSRYFEMFGNWIFVNHEYNGVFKLSVDASLSKVKNVIKDTSIQGSNSGLVRYNEDLLYSYKQGIFKFDSLSNRFVKDSLLTSVYDENDYESGKLIVNADDDKLWIFTKSKINFVAPTGLTSNSTIKSIPLTKEMRDGILGYENIIKLGDNGTYLLGKTSGYIAVNINDNRNDDFQVHIGNIGNGTRKTNDTLINKNIAGSFENHRNDFNFSFYVPEYNRYLRTEYQYQLQGMYDDWSDWSESAEVFYENLPFGDYLFNVRAKIGNKVSDNIASYSFEIRKPWYVSNTMVVLYILGFIILIFLTHNIYKQYYKKQGLKLIEKNKQELKLARIQNEKEIIKIQNEQLEQENKSKSKELAASTMSIIKKNELLTAIKEELNTVSDKNTVRSVIKIIDKSLRQNDDWELFQEAFNNADSEFLKNVKTLHSSLSPNDLKLCAYLRLNLSSKEIAKLLNISPKSVEIKRYRLRKKLNLQHHDNLVNYILEL